MAFVNAFISAFFDIFLSTPFLYYLGCGFVAFSFTVLFSIPPLSGGDD